MTRTFVITLLSIIALATGCVMADDSIGSYADSQAPVSDEGLEQVGEQSDEQFDTDARYVRGLLGKRGERGERALSLDFADPVQYRFIMERLRRGG